MEHILSSDQHKFKNNCLRYTFQKPIRFQNQYIFIKRVIIKSLQCHLKLKKMKTELLHLANF